jgi:uncharacterized protein YceK
MRKSNIIKNFLTSLLLLTSFPGCGTIVVTSDCGPRIFGGSQADLFLGVGYFPVTLPLLVDLPLSFCADLILLPAAIILYDEHQKSIFHGMGGC